MSSNQSRLLPGQGVKNSPLGGGSGARRGREADYSSFNSRARTNAWVRLLTSSLS
jgi:hypothetical protein